MTEEHRIFLLDWRAIQGSTGDRSVGYSLPNGVVVIRHNGNASNTMATESQARAMYPKLVMLECPVLARRERIRVAAYYLWLSDDRGEVQNWLIAEKVTV